MTSQNKTKQMIAALNRSIGREELLRLVCEGTSTRKIAVIASDRLGKDVSQYYIVKTLQSYGDAYQEAKLVQAQLHAERVGQIAEDVAEARLDPASARVSADNFKWLASKLDPKQYGDKTQVDVNVTDVNALHLNQLKARMMAVARVLPDKAIEHQEGEDPTLVAVQ